MGTKPGYFKSFPQVSVWPLHQALGLLILLSCVQGKTNQVIGAIVFVNKEPNSSEPRGMGWSPCYLSVMGCSMVMWIINVTLQQRAF